MRSSENLWNGYQLNEKHIVYRLMCRAKQPLFSTMYTMEPSPYSERFTIACNHGGEPAGEASNAVYSGGSAG